MIYYFSGTGNSAFAAERIGEKTGDEVRDLRPLIKAGEGIRDGGEQERLVFVMPIYGWRIPRIVEDLIRRSRFTGKTPAYFVLTCGSDMGNAASYVKRLCADTGLLYMGCGELVMPENYIAMFNAPEEEEAREIVKKALPVMDGYAKLIADLKPIPDKRTGMADRIKSSIVNPVFCSLIVRDGKFRVSEDCTGCGRCAEVCPAGDIRMASGRPEWLGRCIHCMDCITGCPEEAIEYGNISVGKPRYRCPDIRG